MVHGQSLSQLIIYKSLMLTKVGNTSEITIQGEGCNLTILLVGGGGRGGGRVGGGSGPLPPGLSWHSDDG